MANLPEKENVKISREAPAKDCTSLGKVEGRTQSVKGTQDDALRDLQQEAANKGANYLLIKEFSGTGQSVTGVAFKCP